MIQNPYYKTKLYFCIIQAYIYDRICADIYFQLDCKVVKGRELRARIKINAS